LIARWDDDNTVGFGLTGSYVRGDAQLYSDVDLWQFVQAMPDDPFAEYTLRQEGDFLISLSLRTIESQREKMARPEGALSAVPGLRQMRVLLDKTGAVTALIQEARDFQWESLQAAADVYASHELLGNSEEAYKLMSGLRLSDDHMILFWLPWLVVGLTRAVAIHRGILTDSENTFYRQVQQAMGYDSAWTQAHRLAMGTRMASPNMQARAGLRLYRETAAVLSPILLPEHEAVIDRTLRQLARFVD
ncbi:MAG: hypothetical protein K8J31_07665, partial [Anaerolineae bacterium]|nr:hypothetical protein [Anaerolineae bacterium]